MGWDKGRYYTRSKKANGQVIRQYVGTGPRAKAAARKDIRARKKRQNERAAWNAERARLEALDIPLDELNNLADLLVRAALRAAGFHQHKRGEWRKQRGQQNESR